MKRRRLSILAVVGMLATLLPVGAAPAAAATAFVETFDDSSAFTISEPFFSDAGGDYLGLTNGSTGDFGLGAVPSALKPYTGFDGNFLAGMDLDGEGATLPIVLNWTGIDVAGLSSLVFSGDFAEYFDDPGDIDPADYLRIDYQIDGGGYEQLLWFSGADFSSTVNGIFRDDTDFDGVGDGAALGNAAATFTKPVAGSGTSLDLRLTVRLDSGDEDFAVDNLVIEGDSGSTGPADLVINEFVANHTGTDTEAFLEVFGDPSTDYSAFTLLEIEGDSDSNEGVIDAAIAVGATDAGGFWIDDEDMENGTVTVLLVEDFSGSVGDDLDTDDDGAFDSTPWIRVVDDVATTDGTAGDRAYSSTVLAAFFDGNPFGPGGASRIPNGADTDTDADWMRNDFDGEGFPGFSGTPESGEAANTPGAVNQPLADPVADVLINEVDSDTPGTDTLEFIELYDGGTGDTALDGLVVVLFNGSDDASYDAFDLDGYSTDANGYFVLGNPGVANVDLTFGSNGLQNGADAVAVVVGDADDFTTDTAIPTSGIVDAIVYDTNDPDDGGLAPLLVAGGQVNEGGNGDKDNHSNQRCPNGSGSARDTSTYEQWIATPGVANVCEAVVVITDLLISEVQGSGPEVTGEGTLARVTGVVVGDYQGGDELDGFFLQEEDADVDADPNTSEGIFIFCDPCSVAVAEGNIVQVVGVQEEFFGMSQLDVGAAGADGAVIVVDGGNNLALVTAEAVDLPAAASTTAEGTFEQVEGMLVEFEDVLTVTEYFELGRYGQVVLSEGGRLRQFTNDNFPSVAGYAAHLEEVSKRRIILDDINNWQNIDEVYHPQPGGFAVDNYIRGGDTVIDLTGVMHWSWAGSGGTDAWRVRPQVDTPVQFSRTNPRDTAPADVGGSIKVATLNVLNYFTTIDEPGSTCGPLAEGCRGANSEAERLRQLDKIVSALAGMDADVVGLVEIENNESASLESITDALSLATSDAWDYVDAGYVGEDVIKVGFIYNSDTVSASGSFAVLDTDDFVDPNNTGSPKNRAALAETFTEKASGASFTAVVNHLKSKGSGCGFGDDDTTTGQGNCALTRALAAAELADWLETDPTGSGDADVIVLGDLNAYAMEDAITALKDGADDTTGTDDDYVDLVDTYVGTSDAYSFVFSGEWGYLDHALANNSLAAQVTGATHWHINADEVNLLDYNDTIQDATEAFFEAKPSANPLYAPDAFRASDHDPVIIGLDLTPSQVLKETTAGDLADLLPTGDRLTDKRLDKAIDSINDSLNEGWWSDENTIVSKRVFDAERQAIAQLMLVAGDLPEAAAAIDSLLTADRQLALAELFDAIDRGGSESKIADAYAALDDAAAYISAGMYVDAVNAYKAAWDAAHKA